MNSEEEADAHGAVSSSEVSVPVLSNNKTSTAPANWMRKGSVQKMPERPRACTNCGRRRQFHGQLGRVPHGRDDEDAVQPELEPIFLVSFKPSWRTYKVAITAKMSKTPINFPVSVEPVTCSVMKSMVRA